MSLNLGKPNLLSADDRCVIDGQRLIGLPLLVDSHNQPVLVASNWLRDLAVSGKVAQSSLEQYAKTLRNFWQAQDSDKIEAALAELNRRVQATTRIRGGANLEDEG
jgi:hypothetical protein